ncbi:MULTISPECIES: hypothetical protein [unclassified Streptomyces]|uniref:hypothetical protein n=1 Tax=Streptomyces sp. NPDC127532 TaxID=3345399 RepID=UPI003631929A
MGRHRSTSFLDDGFLRQGHRLSAALFGPGPIPPRLLWTMIHTCEDLVTQGLLEREEE